MEDFLAQVKTAESAAAEVIHGARNKVQGILAQAHADGKKEVEVAHGVVRVEAQAEIEKAQEVAKVRYAELVQSGDASLASFKKECVAKKEGVISQLGAYCMTLIG